MWTTIGVGASGDSHTDHVRVFLEKQTAKQPIQKQMESDAGLVRRGTVLGAINEWRTWFSQCVPCICTCTCENV